jgi:hypothetical protein
MVGWALLPVVQGCDGHVPCGSDGGGAHVSERGCLVSAVRVALSCTRGVALVADAATELRSIRDACARSTEQ